VFYYYIHISIYTTSVRREIDAVHQALATAYSSTYLVVFLLYGIKIKN
jgi:hypothetical protein